MGRIYNNQYDEDYNMKLIEQLEYVVGKGTDIERTMYPDPIVELTKYDIHQICAIGKTALLRACPMNTETRKILNSDGCISYVKVVPADHGDEWTPELIAKWNRNMNKLFNLIGELDTDIHDDAEYTCG